jgi:hypothetical protein
MIDNRYSLYEPEHMDDEGLTEKAEALIDEFVATLTIEDLTGITDHVCDEAWNLVNRCAAYCTAHGSDINALGFSDTASRECFLDAAFEEVGAKPPTATEVAETLINGNISTAREAIVLNRTPHEVAVFTLDVLVALTDLSGEPHDGDAFAEAVVRLRRCVNRG